MGVLFVDSKLRDQLRPLFIGGVVLAFSVWFGAIIVVGALGLVQKEQPQLPNGLDAVFTGIGSILATTFGATLGISQYLSGNPLPRARSAIRGTSFEWPRPNVIATYVYAIGLLVGAVLLLVDADNANAAAVLQGMGATLIGALVGFASVFVTPTQP